MNPANDAGCISPTCAQPVSSLFFLSPEPQQYETLDRLLTTFVTALPRLTIPGNVSNRGQ